MLQKHLPKRPLFASLSRALRVGLLSSTLLLFLSTASSLSAQSSVLPTDKLDQLITELLLPVAEDGPGLALYLHQKEKGVYRSLRGKSNLEYNLPLTEQSVFDLASVAKQFTGYAIAQLELDGKIKLTDNIRDYLPEVPDFGTPITLQHLLHHTSGLRDVGELYGFGNFNGAFTATIALDIVARQEALNFSPGSEHDYSNTGYVLLALVVEKVSGQSFDSWCQENIFRPLGMNNSMANASPTTILPDRAVAYYGKGGQYSFDQMNGMSLIGSSAVFSSLADMSKWITFLAGDDLVAKKMRTAGQLGDGTRVGYGYGLSIHQLGDQTLITHSGATPAGFRTLTAFLPALGIELVILGNWGNLEPVEDLGQPILSMLLENLKAVDPVTEEDDNTSIVLPAAVIERYTGEYLFNGERPVTISRDGQQLLATVAGMGTVPLEARSERTFFLEPMNSLLTVEIANDQVQKIRIQEGGQDVGVLTPVVGIKTMLPPPVISGYFYSRELDQTFSLEVKDKALWLSSAKHGAHKLTQLTDLTFASQQGLFERLTLVLAPKGEVTHFTINLGSRARQLPFYPSQLIVQD